MPILSADAGTVSRVVEEQLRAELNKVQTIMLSFHERIEALEKQGHSDQGSWKKRKEASGDVPSGHERGRTIS